MPDREQPSTDAKVAPLQAKPRGNPLGFSLEFRDQTALVGLVDRRVTRALVIDRLEMEVPDVTFPFDVSGGAEQFRHRRCRLRLLKLSVGQADLAAYLTAALEPDRFGISLMDCSLDAGQGRLAGRFRVGAQQVEFSARFTAQPGRGWALILNICLKRSSYI